ncbi:Platelet-activating factor acetylhydrolase 2-like protein [Cladobotryum mycophilum]|uniref:Putative phospholipase n=1 Tax=Cladobotryum mycophilum TaxID=491253 RepID=A0ABR0S925_9HYPO
MQHQTSSDDSEFEMDPVNDDPSLSPDSPLIGPTSVQPRWLLRQRYSGPRTWLPWPRRRFTTTTTTITTTTAWFASLIRPRWSWRYVVCASVVLYATICFAQGQPLLASSLPAYTGPHDVGAMDLEIPLDKPRLITNTVFRNTGEPAFELTTTLFTVYYPVAKGARETKPRHNWIPRPISLKAEGYAKFAHLNNFITRPIFTFALWAISGSIRIPAKVDAPLLVSVSASASGSVSATDGHKSATNGSGSESERFPVMVFSHGDASSRTDYSNFVGELASRGYVVAALEHRDGSGAGSLIKIKGQPDRSIKEQLTFRDAEIFETIGILRAINDGKGDDIFALNSRNEGNSLHAWTDRLDFDKLTIGGHSFGATGALQALKGAPSATNPAVGGIILDPGKSSGPLNKEIDVPILVIHSNSWSKAHSIFYGRPHFDTVRDLVQGVLRRAHASWFLTSLGTSHPSVTDAPLIEPLLLSCTTGANLNTKAALKEYVRVTDEFWGFLRTGHVVPEKGGGYWPRR